ncbi:MAG TPA: L-threonylcarbamoyladenylate synthase [Steroidobacter sp.]|nr:L-threonylcarbamoyladenylate synthase [Steroidobacter sp.]
MAIGRVLQQEILEAVEALRAGELVAFPTETVYGLGANANNPEAVRKIFRVKGRPAAHPVIVHIDHPRYLQRWVREMSPEAKQLAEAFWPGPLTLVAKRAPAVSDVITGGQDTVAIRVPNHPVALQLLNAFGGGVAAPSANRYGGVSPTRAEHVRDEFSIEEVKIVLDGGDCKVGLESTIVSCVRDAPRVLRPGAITLSQLRAVTPSVQMGEASSSPRTPGSMARHYSPRTPVNVAPSRRLEQVAQEFTANHQKVAVLAQRPPIAANQFMTWINAGARPDQYARQLYANLRTLDKAGAKVILVEEPPEGEKWDAVRDRLRRAATAENIVTYDQDIAAWVADFGEESSGGRG